jgi:hypothetical protein
LEHNDVRENIVVEEAAHSAGVVTAEFDLLAHLVPGVAMAFYTLDRSDDPKPNSWLTFHGVSLLFSPINIILVVSKDWDFIGA